MNSFLLDKYQEIIYQWDPATGERVNPEGHFGLAYGGTNELAENITMFTREGVIKTPDLGKLHHIEEAQSDWWQKILQEQAEDKEERMKAQVMYLILMRLHLMILIQVI